MNAYEVLKNKTQDVINDQTISIPKDELKILLDSDQLRALKFYKNPEKDYSLAVSESACIDLIKSDKDIYRTLELLLRRVSVLKKVAQIFTMYGGLFHD